MKYEIRSIGIWSLIKVGFFINLVLGFLFGIFSSLIFIPLAKVILAMAGAGELPDDGGSSTGLLFVLPPLMGILGAFFNTLFMVLIAAGYNLVARVVGGLEINFREMPDTRLLHMQPVQDNATFFAPAAAPASESPIILPQPLPPYRPAPVVPIEDDEESPSQATFALPDELPVKIRQPEEDSPETSLIVEPHTEPDEEGPRQDNP